MDLSDVIAQLYPTSPYQEFDSSGYEIDLQGWASDSPIFRQLLTAKRPLDVIEVGTWKGASAIGMGEIARDLGLDMKILCVDTWLGSNPELWDEEETSRDLMRRHGFPQIYFQFLANVIKTECESVIFPLPMTSACAAKYLSRKSVAVDFIYIDAGHDFDEVQVDLDNYWPLLKPGGVLLGDDYLPRIFPGVVQAVHAFADSRGVTFERHNEKWLIHKSPDRP